MRVFIALWPPPEAGQALARLPRPDHPSVRWTTPEQWHVTLRFLGELRDDQVAAVTEALRAPAVRLPPRPARLGPATARLGRGTLMVPVAGVDDLGAAVVDATRGLGRPPQHRPFTGHVTVARGRGRRPVPVELAGNPVEATWPVQELAVVRSHLERAGARYETVATVPLTGAPAASSP